MTYDEAWEIVTAWGVYLEHSHARLVTIFFLGHLPASLLPYPKQVLEDAINAVAKYYFDMGDYATSDFFKSTCGPLMLYSSDDYAIEQLFKILNMPGLNATTIILDKLREYQASIRS